MQPNQLWLTRAKREFMEMLTGLKGGAERPQVAGQYLEIYKNNSLKGNQGGQRPSSKNQCPFRWTF